MKLNIENSIKFYHEKLGKTAMFFEMNKFYTFLQGFWGLMLYFIFVFIRSWIFCEIYFQLLDIIFWTVITGLSVPHLSLKLPWRFSLTFHHWSIQNSNKSSPNQSLLCFQEWVKEASKASPLPSGRAEMSRHCGDKLHAEALITEGTRAATGRPGGGGRGRDEQCTMQRGPFLHSDLCLH